MSEVEMVIPEKPVFTPSNGVCGMVVDIPRNNELKPCPFCGSVDVKIIFKPGDEGWFGQCQNCFSRGAWSENRDEARDKWNRRAQNA